MDHKKNENIALFRYGVISPLVSGTNNEESSNNEFFKSASNKTYMNQDGYEVMISSSTISRWYRKYMKDGFDGLIPLRRSDIGYSRKIDSDVINQIAFLKNEYPKLPATLIYQKLIDNNTITKKSISLSTITRYIKTNFKEKVKSSDKVYKRYEKEHINEVWYGDSTVGPYITINKKKQRTYIIALIDDASRLVVGFDIFLNDNFVNLMQVIKSAVSTYGRPTMFSFDNGTPYKNKQMDLLIARLGTSLNYCLPNTPTSKAKIERWFKTMKTQWLSGIKSSEYKSLEDLRTSLNHYVSSYNLQTHSSLNGRCPSDRFFSESPLIKRLSESDIEKIFLIELERKVSIDSVILIDGIQYEVDYRYASQKIIIRYTPDLSSIFVVDKSNGEYQKMKILNKIDNSKIKRTKVELTGDES